MQVKSFREVPAPGPPGARSRLPRRARSRILQGRSRLPRAAVALGAVLALAACTPSTTGSAVPPASSPALTGAGPAAAGQLGTASSAPPASSPTGTPAPAGSVPAVRAATVPGHGRVLVDGAGRTLYHLAGETAGGVGNLICTGACTRTWHPLGLPAGDLRPVPGPGVPDRLGVVVRPDGAQQVAYRGEPLYTYAGDRAPGQARGQGVGGAWSVIPVGRA
ncbi:MAG: COG4315 family predicted lipoprotein [Acidimicrobiales bacterium]